MEFVVFAVVGSGADLTGLVEVGRGFALHERVLDARGGGSEETLVVAFVDDAFVHAAVDVDETFLLVARVVEFLESILAHLDSELRQVFVLDAHVFVQLFVLQELFHVFVVDFRFDLLPLQIVELSLDVSLLPEEFVFRVLRQRLQYAIQVDLLRYLLDGLSRQQ